MTHKNVLHEVSTPQLASFPTMTAQAGGQRGPTGRSSSDSYVAGSQCSQGRPLSPPVLPDHFEKTLFCLHVQVPAGLVCFFGTINKRSNFFLSFLSLPIRAASSSDSSVAHKLTWPNGLMNACIRTAYCYQNGMWEYAMHLQVRNDQEIKI